MTEERDAEAEAERKDLLQVQGEQDQQAGQQTRKIPHTRAQAEPELLLPTGIRHTEISGAQERERRELAVFGGEELEDKRGEGYNWQKSEIPQEDKELKNYTSSDRHLQRGITENLNRESALDLLEEQNTSKVENMQQLQRANSAGPRTSSASAAVATVVSSSTSSASQSTGATSAGSASASAPGAAPSGGELTLTQRALSASVGALLTSMLVTPLDVVKTRMQAQAQQFEYINARSPAACVRCTHYQFNNGLLDVMLPKETVNHTLRECPYHLHNTADALYKITKYEGVSALYNGLRPSLIMAVPSTVLYFSCYDYLRNTYRDEFGFSRTAAALTAGSSARVIAATVISPLELVRTKMQASNTPQTIQHLVSTQIQRKGFTSLWQGLTPTLFRDVPFSAIYWAVVERSKEVYRPKVIEWLHSRYGTSQSTLEEFTTSFLAGATGGMIAATLTNPFDVIKTRRQVFDYAPDVPPEVLRKESSTIHIARKIMATEGSSGFMVGLTPRLAKTMPACAIMLSSYEAAKRVFANENEA